MSWLSLCGNKRTLTIAIVLSFFISRCLPQYFQLMMSLRLSHGSYKELLGLSLVFFLYLFLWFEFLIIYANLCV